jgi:hypothetical protein
MVSVTYNLRIDRVENAVVGELMGAGGIVHDDILRRAKNVKFQVENNIYLRAKKNSANGLARSIEGETFREDGDEWSAIIYTNKEHALWFEEGTGLHGPLNHYIFPRFHKAMIFVPYGKTSRVYGAKSEGQEAHHAFRDAIDAAVP